MKITILGCGSSGGVPLITGEWGKCDPDNPKNRRRRSSILVQTKGKNILIDTGPDLKEQLLGASVKNIDLILYTHAHADHVSGIDDLRQLCLKNACCIPAYADADTMAHLHKAYGYIFTSPDPLYPAFLESRLLEGAFTFEGIDIMPFLQHHGTTSSYGFRFGNFAYSTDLIDLPDESQAALQGLDLWIVDCTRETPHIGHANVEQTLKLIERVSPQRAIVTHMSHHLDYEEMAARLPSHIRPAYDGMVLAL